MFRLPRPACLVAPCAWFRAPRQSPAAAQHCQVAPWMREDRKSLQLVGPQPIDGALLVAQFAVSRAGIRYQAVVVSCLCNCQQRGRQKSY